MYPGECPRCEKRIAVGQEIHRVADFDGCVHFGCGVDAAGNLGRRPWLAGQSRIRVLLHENPPKPSVRLSALGWK